MTKARSLPPLTAEAFIASDQAKFGTGWRYDLVDGSIVAHATPSPDHAAILAAFGAALYTRLRAAKSECRVESGSTAVPNTQQRSTARIPDLLVRCGDHPRVVIEIVSPAELRSWRARDRKRLDLQRVEGVTEIIEVYQDDAAVHALRRDGDLWSLEAIGGLDAVIALPSLGIEVPLAEIYGSVRLSEDKKHP